MAKSVPELTPEDSAQEITDQVVEEVVEEVQDIFSQPEDVVEIQAEPEVVVEPTPQVIAEEVESAPEPVANPQRTRVSDGGIVFARSRRNP